MWCYSLPLLTLLAKMFLVSVVLIIIYMIYLLQIFHASEKIESINDQYWTLRAEEVNISVYDVSNIWRQVVMNLNLDTRS